MSSSTSFLPPDLLPRPSGEEDEEECLLFLLDSFSDDLSLLEGLFSSDLSRPLTFSSDFSLLREPLSFDLSLLESLSFDLSLLESLSFDLSLLPDPLSLDLSCFDPLSPDLSRLLEDLSPDLLLDFDLLLATTFSSFSSSELSLLLPKKEAGGEAGLFF